MSVPISCSLDDDLYSLYGALASGHDTFLVSNDKLGDKRALLVEPSLSLLLDHWRTGHQVAVTREPCLKVGCEGRGFWGELHYTPSLLPPSFPPNAAASSI